MNHGSDLVAEKIAFRTEGAPRDTPELLSRVECCVLGGVVILIVA
jgi:hypothetical protein